MTGLNGWYPRYTQYCRCIWDTLFLKWVRGVERASQTIKVRPSTKKMLRRLGRFGDSYDTIIRRLLTEAEAKCKGEAAIPEEVLGFLEEVAEASDGVIVDVGDALSRLIVKLGAVLGYKGEAFDDWGVREVAKAKIVTFLGIDDPLMLKTAILNQTLNSLIEEEGIRELIPLRDEILYILAQARLRRSRSHET